MKCLLAAVIAVLAPLSAFSQAQEVNGGVYIAVGDSIAAGVGSSLPRTRSYPAILRDWMNEYLGAPVVLENLAVPGETAESFIDGDQFAALEAAVGRAANAGQPLLAVTVTLGGNELLEVRDANNDEREQALSDFESSLPAALEAIRAVVGPDVPVLLSTIYDPTGTEPELQFTEGWWIARFNEVIERSAGQIGATLIDAASGALNWSGELSRYPSDVHPTNAGHRALAGVFWAALALDDEPPEIVIRSDSEATRLTPTLRFTIAELIDDDTLLVTVEGGEAYPPVEVADGEYVVLLEADGDRVSELDVEIRAADPAGNEAVARETIMIARPAN